MRLCRAGVVFVAAAVLLAGCRVDTRVDITLHRDGSGVVQATVTLDADALQRLGGIAAAQGDVPLGDLQAAGWTVGPWKPVGQGASITLSAPFADASELATRLEQLTGKDGLLRDPRVTRDRGWFGTRDGVSLVIDLRAPDSAVRTDAELVARLRAAGVDPAALDADLSRELRASIHLTVALHLPDGSTRVVAATNGRLSTVAVSSSKTDYDALVKVGIAVLLLALAGLLILAASIGKRRDRRRRTARGTEVDRERAPLM